jgi:hypothetical protein
VTDQGHGDAENIGHRREEQVVSIFEKDQMGVVEFIKKAKKNFRRDGKTERYPCQQRVIRRRRVYSKI